MRLVPIERSGIVAAPVEGCAETVLQVVAATASLYARRGCHPPWICYLAVEDEKTLGTCGFTGPPIDGEVEIAYFTFPGNEGQGVATAMARELMSLSRAAATLAGTRYIAYTLPQNGPSTTILEKLGFILEADFQHPEDGPVWKWAEACAKTV